MSGPDKSVLRAQALAARAAGGDQDALTRHLIAALVPHRGKVLAGYWPMRGEPDPRPAMAAHDGAVCLPVVPGKAVPLVFRGWRGEPLVPGPFGTSHPADSQPVLTPQVLIVPLAGFDRQGNRVGYGGGYYDRTLATLPGAAAIGCAYACQELPEVPAGPEDWILHAIATEAGVIRVP